MTINDTTPTSILLEIKVGFEVQNDTLIGVVSHIDIQDYDDHLMFLFTLDNINQIMIKKIRQVC